jgi:hypothetical protein
MSRSPLCLLVLVLAGQAAVADDGQPKVYGKPRAPVAVDWPSAEAHDRIVTVVHPESDYERLELVLVRPGRGDPLRRLFGPGTAGEAVRVEWETGAGDGATRLLVIMTVDGQPLKRASGPPGRSADDESSGAAAGPGRVDREAGLRILPATREPED